MDRKILLVDDSKIERVVLRGYLRADYEILETASGEAALAALREHGQSISAVVMDVLMPGMDGFETLRRMKQNPEWIPIPVIVATGLDEEEAREKAVICGADSFVAKPFNRQLLLHVVQNAIKLRETAALADALRRDTLTGLLNRESFFAEAERMLRRHEDGFYILSCLDIEGFKVVNDQYGTEVGDAVLRHIAGCLSTFAAEVGGLACRYMADKFAVLFPSGHQESEAAKACCRTMTRPACVNHTIRLCVGRYLARDRALSVSAMYDRASMAARSVKGRYDTFRAEYTESMRQKLLREQQIVNDMLPALENGEFIPWFQPQYNHVTGAVIGAEALARWVRDGQIIPPNSFIPAFEKNGFVYEMDKSIWRQVCACLRRWLDEGKPPLPISVNISRYDIFQEGFLDNLCGMVKEYDLPVGLLRLEITESAFAESSGTVIQTVGKLIKRGFTVEIDDFGSGYSSLNTLKDVPASILKLDMRFFENTGDSKRGGNIVESVVRMAKWLGMAVIAEGVEKKTQADYLKSIGCSYIQGYYYARPVPLADYEALLAENAQESKLSQLQTLDTLNQNEFWNPASIETLIFNSYAGAACIMEYADGGIEMLRASDYYIKELGSRTMGVSDVLRLDWRAYMDAENRKKFDDAVMESARTRESVSCELELLALPGCPKITYLRLYVRVIADDAGKYMVYCLLDNMTAQREAEKRSTKDAETFRAVLNHAAGGISAVVFEQGKARFLFANENFFALMGYTREQFEAEVKIPYDIVHPEDRARVKGDMAALLTRGGSRMMEYRIIRRDGTVIWIRNALSIVSFEDVRGPVILSIYSDISDLHQAQQEQRVTFSRLRAIMESVSDGITATIFHGRDDIRLLFASSGYYKLFGYTREQFDAEIKNPIDLIVPEEREEIARQIADVVRENGSASYEYRCQRRDGSLIWAKTINSMIRLEGVEEPVLLGTTRDITERREAEEQMRFLNESAHEILAQPDSERVIDDALHKLLTYFAAQRAYVVELDEEGGLTNNTYEVCAEGVRAEKENLQAIPYDHASFWYAKLCRDEFFIIENVDDVRAREPALYELLRMQNIQNLVLAPLRRDGAMVGFVGMDNLHRAMHQIGKLTAFADYFAILLTRRDLARGAAEEARRQRLLLDNLPIGAALLAFDGKTLRVSHVNKRYSQLVHRNPCVVPQDYPAEESIHPADRAAVFAEMRSAIAEGRCGAYDVRLRCGEGEYRAFHMDSAHIRREDGSYDVYVAYSRVSEAELAHQAEAAQLKLLTDSIPGGIATFRCTAEGITAVYLNDGFRSLSGYSKEEFIKDQSQLLDFVFAEDLPLVRRQLSALLSDGAPIDCNFRIHAKNGGFYWVNCKASEAGQDGEAHIVNAILTDVTELQKDKERLLLAEEEYRLAVAQSGHDIGRYNIATKTLTLSLSASRRLALPESVADVPEGIVRKGLVSVDTAPAFLAFYGDIISGEPESTCVFQRRMQGRWRWIRAAATDVFDTNGKPVSAVISYTDVTEQREKDAVYAKWQNSLRSRSADSFTLFRCNLSRGGSLASQEGALLPANDAHSDLPFSQRISLFAERWVCPEDREKYRAFLNADSLLAAYYLGKRSASLDFRRREDGREQWLRVTVDLMEYPNAGEVEAYLMYEDIDKAKREELANVQLAETDPLTGILNRRTFISRMEAIIKASADAQQHALLMMDIDDFKRVNDTLGHGTGDQVLRDMTATISAALRRGDLIGRLGGDEFFVFLNDVAGRENAGRKAAQICGLRIPVHGSDAPVTVSLGVAMLPQDGCDFDTLYKKVDRALYLAKEGGKNRFVFASA